METIPDATLQALDFHHSPLDYFEEGAPRVVDVTDKPELTIELEDNSQPITDSEDEKVRKSLECAAKKKTQRNNFCASVRQAFAAGSATPLLSGPALLSCLLVPALSSRPRLPTPLLSYSPMPTLSSHFLMPVLLSCPGSPTLLLSCLHMPALLSPPVLASSFCPPMPALSSPSMSALAFCFVLGPTPTQLISSTLRTFK